MHRYGCRLTAEGRDGSVDGLDEDTFPVQLNSNKHQPHHHRIDRIDSIYTSSHVLVSNRIHPSSITSAESFVT